MPEALAVFWHQALEKILHVEGHVRVCIFLDHQRAGSVLDEQRQKPVGNLLPGNPIFHRVGKQIEPFPPGCDRKGRMRVSQIPV